MSNRVQVPLTASPSMPWIIAISCCGLFPRRQDADQNSDQSTIPTATTRIGPVTHSIVLVGKGRPSNTSNERALTSQSPYPCRVPRIDSA